MLSGRAFRAQLLTQGQRELFDYWRLAAAERRMPARSDFDPLRVPRLLPSIGLIEVRGGLAEAVIRLAGTRLRDIYGGEITGKLASEVFSGTQADYWHRVHARVLGEGVPLSGAVKGPARDREHVILFWMRLPLSEDGGTVDRILCFDVPGPSAEICRSEDVSYPQARRYERPPGSRLQVR